MAQVWRGKGKGAEGKDKLFHLQNFCSRCKKETHHPQPLLVTSLLPHCSPLHVTPATPHPLTGRRDRDQNKVESVDHRIEYLPQVFGVTDEKNRGIRITLYGSVWALSAGLTPPHTTPAFLSTLTLLLPLLLKAKYRIMKEFKEFNTFVQ